MFFLIPLALYGFVMALHHMVEASKLLGWAPYYEPPSHGPWKYWASFFPYVPPAMMDDPMDMGVIHGILGLSAIIVTVVTFIQHIRAPTNKNL